MAATLSPSSSSPHDHGIEDRHIPTALALPAVTAVVATSARRLPPPCWTPDETSALIDAYRDKWYSLRRSNLRANHWEEVAADVASRCLAAPPKTAVQCRHKMEKLRKRYRAEIQRATARGGVRRYASSWAHFQSMHTMERGPGGDPSPSSSNGEEDDADDDRQNSIKRINDLYDHGYKQKGYSQPLDHRASGGVRIKVPSGMPPIAKEYNMFDEVNTRNPNHRFPDPAYGGYEPGSNKVFRDGFLGRSEFGKRAGEGVKRKKMGAEAGSEVAAAIQLLGEGFMRMEKMKMDMGRQIEEIRMEMELKRTQMILESQQRIVEAFAKAIAETSLHKKAKRMHSMPDC